MSVILHANSNENSVQKQSVDSISPKTKIFETRHDTQKGYIGNSKDFSNPVNRERENQSIVKSRTPIGKSKAHDSRARAKFFLKLMHRHGYTFEDLAKENLDIGILKDLYSELGFTAGLYSKVSPKLSLPPRPKSPEAIKPTKLPLRKPAILQEQLDKSKDGSHHLNTKATDEKVTTKIDNAENNSNIAQKKPAKVNQLIDKAHNSMLVGDKQKVKEAKRQEPILDREDYIARLQAAKNQKSISALPNKPAETAASAANKSEDVTSPENKLPEKPEEPPKIQPMNDMAEKKRNQTELARQKMEALAAMKKSNDSAKDKLATSVLEPKKPLIMSSPRKSGKEPLKAKQDLPIAHSAELDPQVVKPPFASFTESDPQAVNPLSASFADSGCQAVKPPTASFAISGSQDESLSSALPNKPEIQDEVETSGIMQSIQPNPIDNNSRANSMGSRSIPGLFMTVEGRPPTGIQAKPIYQQTSTELRSKKRPVASDFDDFSFQPPTKSVKGPFGNSFSNSHHDEEMIIHVSEDESSESESEGEIITDKSQNGGLSDTTNSQLNLQTPRRNDLPPLSDFPRRTLSTKRLSCYSGSGRISPSGTQSPASSVALEKTQEQIFSIKRKIAELEERKKQKLVAIQADNPSETPASLEKMVEIMVKENDVKSSDGLMTGQGESLSTQHEPTKEVLAVTERESMTEISKPDGSPRTGALRAPESSEVPHLEEDLQRKDKLQKTLATSDAALAMTKAQLDQLRKDVEEAEFKLREQTLQKEKLAQEFKALSVISLPESKVADGTCIENDKPQPDVSWKNGNI